jgi:threonine/homoserine/homoserine lactone efflux protein
MSGFGLRFAVEVGFLALLALAAGLAELETQWIVAVMVVGWVLVALVEWLAWRSETATEEPPVVAAETSPEEQTSWGIEEILAPVPEDDER